MAMIDFDEKNYLANFPERPDEDEVPDMEAPVRLTIDNIDLLGWEHGWPQNWHGPQSGGDGILVFVILFAWWGPVALKQAKLTGGSVYWLGSYGDQGALLFKMSGDDILVHSTPYKKTVKVKYELLEQAWNDFADRVRAFVLREMPTLKNKLYGPGGEPGWQEWLAGKESSDLPTKLIMTVDLWYPHFEEKYAGRFDRIDAVES